MKLTICPLAGNEAIARSLARKLSSPLARLEHRRFPDGESYVRLRSRVAGRAVVIVCTLEHPDEKLVPLIFAAETARAYGATSVSLVSPYLAYLRQDKIFKPGEGVTSAYFAKALSQWVDCIVTVDPHLHRTASLSQIYDIPTVIVPAAPSISAWIRKNVKNPVIVGPDSESEQWVASIAREVVAPHVVLKKIRRGDRDVEVTGIPLERWQDRNPIVMDDIVSTAITMAKTVELIRRRNANPPICVAVHGIFAADAYATLRAAGAAAVITCNTIPHETNRIDISASLAEGIRRQIAQATPVFRVTRQGKKG